MYARVTRLESSPGQVDDGIRMVNEQVIPTAKALAGFTGAYFLADRESGRLLGITLWDSEQHLLDSEVAATKLREDTAQQAGAAVTSVERYEVIAQV